MKRSECPFSLPKGVVPSHGALYRTGSDYSSGKRQVKFTFLCRIDEGQRTLYLRLADLTNAVKGNTPSYFDKFSLTYLPNQSPSWRKESERMIAFFKHTFADFNVTDIRPTDVNDVMLSFGDKKESARKHKSILSKFFNWAILIEGLHITNPCRDVKVEGGAKKLMVWTNEVYYQIYNSLGTNLRPDEGDMMRCYMDLSFLLYQRSTDARLLERKSVGDKMIVVAPTKTRKSSGVEIEIPMTAELRAVIDRAAVISKKWNVVCPYVVHTKQGTAYTPSAISSAFKRAGARVGIKGADAKSIRKFAANQAKRDGHSMEEIQDALGHTDISTTQGYVKNSLRRQSVVELKLPEKPILKT